MRRSEIPPSVGERDREMIGGQRQRLAMEISAADDFAGAAPAREDQGIVRGAIELDG